MTKLKPGDVIHFLGSVPAWGEMRARGMEVTLTSEMLTESQDRNGVSWLELVDDPDAQMRRWRREEPLFARGPWPVDADGRRLPTYREGDPEWQEAREQARKTAHAEADPALRRAALARVTAQFGAAPTTSRTLQHIRGTDGGMRNGR